MLFEVYVFTLASSLSAVRRDDCFRGLFLLNTICVLIRVRQMVATAISFRLLTIRFMRRFRTSHCAFPWHIYMLFLLHRAFWQLPALLGIAVSGLWCYTSPLPKPNLRLVRLSTMMLHLSYNPVRARPDTCLSSFTSIALLESLLRLALVLVVALPLWMLVESCLPTSWSTGPFCAPATFDSCQQGPTARWTSSIGCSCRKDFVLCSADLQMVFLRLG